MSKKPDEQPKPTLQFKCNAADPDNFTRAAKAEGFETRTAWMLYHLRRHAKDTLKSGYVSPS